MNSKNMHTGIYLVTIWSMVIFETLLTDKIKIQQYFIQMRLHWNFYLFLDFLHVCQ